VKRLHLVMSVLALCCSVTIAVSACIPFGTTTTSVPQAPVATAPPGTEVAPSGAVDSLLGSWEGTWSIVESWNASGDYDDPNFPVGASVPVVLELREWSVDMLDYGTMSPAGMLTGQVSGVSQSGQSVTVTILYEGTFSGVITATLQGDTLTGECREEKPAPGLYIGYAGPISLRRTSSPAGGTTGSGAGSGWGALLVSGSEWDGVDVYSNFPRPADYRHYGDSDYGWRWQCVELVQRYYAVEYGFPAHWPIDYAYEAWNAAEAGLLRPSGSDGGPFLLAMENSADWGMPQQGDVVVWDYETPDTSGAGHVAIVVGSDGAHVYVVEQNWSTTGRATLDWTSAGMDDPRASGHIAGWLTLNWGE
jgi:hypothetical protein